MGSTENEQSNEAPVKSGLKVSSTKTSPILVQLAEGNKENDKGGINEKDVWAVRPTPVPTYLGGHWASQRKGQEIIMEDKSYSCKRKVI